jgi:hypothetical protein
MAGLAPAFIVSCAIVRARPHASIASRIIRLERAFPHQRFIVLGPFHHR